MAGSVFSTVALPSGKIRLAAVYVRMNLNSWVAQARVVVIYLG